MRTYTMNEFNQLGAKELLVSEGITIDIKDGDYLGVIVGSCRSKYHCAKRMMIDGVQLFLSCSHLHKKATVKPSMALITESNRPYVLNYLKSKYSNSKALEFIVVLGYLVPLAGDIESIIAVMEKAIKVNTANGRESVTLRKMRHQQNNLTILHYPQMNLEDRTKHLSYYGAVFINNLPNGKVRVRREFLCGATKESLEAYRNTLRADIFGEMIVPLTHDEYLIKRELPDQKVAYTAPLLHSLGYNVTVVGDTELAVSCLLHVIKRVRDMDFSTQGPYLSSLVDDLILGIQSSPVNDQKVTAKKIDDIATAKELFPLEMAAMLTFEVSTKM